MSIATELQNYADGLDDSYDAVDDMGGIIPAHKNMNNLDQAIRTIPQNTGITATTFHWGGSPNYSMYKDSGYTTAATYSDIATAYAAGLVYIADGEDELTYVVVSDIPDAHTITVTSIALPGYEGGTASYTYASSTWTKTATEFQTKLTAGTNVQINGTTISATDTTYTAGSGINISAQNVISATGADTIIYSDWDSIALNGEVTNLYHDSSRTTLVTWAEFKAMADGGGSIILSSDGNGTTYWDVITNIYWDQFDLITFTVTDGRFSVIYEWDANYAAPSMSSKLLSHYTAGTNVSISSTNVISATDTTYSDFTGATSSVAGTNGLVPAPTTSDPDKFLKGDGTWGTPTDTTYTAGTNVSISAQNVISATDTTYSNFVGATASVAGAAGLVPAPAAGDEGKALHGDGTWKDTTAKLVEMAYGESNAWAKFIAAYNAGSIVYCRASSNANPGTGAKTRKAFMAYVNDENSPTSVEFQYVRSVSSKTDSQQCDQVFVYTLKNTSGGTWSVASRNMAPKINVDSTLTKTFSTGANATVTLGANAMTGATGSAAGTAGYVPAPAATDNTKFLKGDGTWADPSITVDSSYSVSDLPTHSGGTTTYSLKKMGNLVLLNSGYIWYSGAFTAGTWASLGSVPASLYPAEEVHTTATVTDGSDGQVVAYGPLIINTSGEIKFKPMATLSSGLYGYSFQATWLL